MFCCIRKALTPKSILIPKKPSFYPFQIISLLVDYSVYKQVGFYLPYVFSSSLGGIRNLHRVKSDHDGLGVFLRNKAIGL